MFIKQIIIQGYRSYKDQTVIEPFSQKHNVIVGRNGSGKSNFFSAIRFVLGDLYKNPSREDRAGMLHEGAGSAVMSAYVEIIFDNSDGRLATNTPEVTLRRTIGLKKDEYTLNRKNTTKTEIQDVLANAGFSQDNPYYIVPQGRVTQITNMKDVDRLQVLKEVAGTNAYEQRRKQTVKTMEDTTQKREKIDEMLEDIRTRLEELEEEKEELRAFQDKDRERKCLEYTIYHKEQQAVEEQLERLSEGREDGMDQTDQTRDQLEAADQGIEAIDHEIAELQQQLRILAEEKSQLEQDRKQTSREKAKMELDVQSLLDNQSTAQQSRAQHEKDLKAVQNQIQKREKELATITPQYAAKREEEKALKQQLQDAEATQQRLLAKQGRTQQFKSKQARDAYLQKEIGEVNMALATRKAVLMQTTEEIADDEAAIKAMETDITNMRSRMENRGDEQQNIAGEVQQKKEEQHQLQDRRKELWREEAKLDSVIDNARSELEKAKAFLNRMMDQNTARGLESVRKYVKDKQIQGAYGTLGELMDFSDKYKTAVEVTAGTSLFNYIVESEEIAAELSNYLTKEKLGRVTFVPLQQVRIRPVTVPNATDAVHLVKKLKYDKHYDKAYQQVFGKTVVCPNLQVAAQYARSHGLSAITPEGDRSDKKGALTGGWHDVKQSRVDGTKKEAAARETYDEAVERKKTISKELEKLNQQVTKCMSDIQRLEQQRMQMEGGYAPLGQELKRRQDDINVRRDDLEKKLRQKENLDGMVRDMGEQLSGFQNEMAGDFKKALNANEEVQLEQATSRIPEFRKQYQKLSGERAELEANKNTIDLELRENLRLRLDELQSVDVDAGASRDGGGSTRLKEKQQDLKRITKALDSVDQKWKDNETNIENTSQSLLTTEKRQGEQKQKVEQLRTKISNHQKNLQKAAAKRSALTRNLTENQNQIRTLGVLPDAAHKAPYTSMDSNKATSKLHKVLEQLKKYGHVNKKAVEQFQQFEKQQATLQDRRKELETSDESIRQLIQHLDQRKDEAIERTFRQVSREFASIFEKLVPAGKGRLIIQRRSDNNNAADAAEDSDSEDEGARRGGSGGGVENYTGVGISVSFNSKHDEQQRIQQLSGGQKCLCALTLIFAIQASDPAPFYLFDEIDANLDAQYRTAVADLLKSSAETGQFICTTFRPEMLRVADKCYSVGFDKKNSSIGVVSREGALDFVEGEMSGGTQK